MKNAQVTPEKSQNEEEVEYVPGKYGLTFFNVIEVLMCGHGYFNKRKTKTQSGVFKINIGAKRYALSTIDSIRYIFDNEKVEKEPGFGRMKLDKDLTDGYIPSIFSNEVSHDIKKRFAMELCKIMRQGKLIPAVEKIAPQYFRTWSENVSKPLQKDCELSILALANDVVSETFLGTTMDSNSSLYYVRGLFKRKYKKAGMAAYRDLSQTVFGCPRLNEIFRVAKEAAISEREAIADLLFMLTFNAIGGIDTTLISALGRFFVLEKQQQLDIKQEIKETIKEKGFTEESLKQMRLLNNFLLEVLRLHPSVELVFGKAKVDFIMPVGTRRYKICAGDLLMGHFLLAQTDEAIFKEPKEFKLERFDENPELIDNLILFHGSFSEEASTANHKCPGQDIALMLLRGLLAYFFAYTEYELTAQPCWTGKSIRRFGCPDNPIGLKTFVYKEDDLEVEEV